jgi:hypothetical protein
VPEQLHKLLTHSFLHSLLRVLLRVKVSIWLSQCYDSQNEGKCGCPSTA